MIRYFFIFILVFLTIHGHAVECILSIPEARNQPQDNPNLTLGINRSNLVWFDNGNLAAQKKVLDNIYHAGARRVRLALQLPYDNALQHILYCNQLGMDVTIWIGAANPAFYIKNSTKRKGIPNPEGQFPFLWDQYRLADLDIHNFQQVLGHFLQKCHKRGAKIEALQILNEVNWADFNGDLPLVEGGWIIDDTTPWKDEHFIIIRQGIQKCGQAIKAARMLVDKIYGSGMIKILPPGMADPTDSWVKNVNGSIVRPALYLQLLSGKHVRQHGEENYLKYTDGIALHIYPAISDTDLKTGRETALQVIQEKLDPIYERVGAELPYWVTEWSYSRTMFNNPPDESKRLLQFQFFLDALKNYRQNEITWGHIILFNFDLMPQYDVYSNSKLLESGKILKYTDY